jgi:DNA-binding MarR family transcriptional regulator
MPEGPHDSPGFLLWRATLRWQRGVAGALAPLDLTHAQFVLLAGLWWHQREGRQPNQLELATHTGMDTKMTSQVVRRLEAKGLLVRQVDAADTRMKRLRATRTGLELVEKAIQAVELADREFFSPVPEHDRLLAILHGLAYPPREVE